MGFGRVREHLDDRVGIRDRGVVLSRWRSNAVRLGKRGVGKQREGDGKTPLGRYPLGKPRRSEAYGAFVPIGYPTDEQRRSGLTGGAIGVHGPDRRVRWLGRFVNAFDTTDGCIGIATDEQMQEVVTWIDRAHPAQIELR